MSLISQYTLLHSRLLDVVTRWYGPPMLGTIPLAGPDDNRTPELAPCLEAWQGADVVLFPDVWPGDLDAFFRLRVLQVLDGGAPLPGLSIVVLASDLAGEPLAAGFADRFRFGWPFARCIFLADQDDCDSLSSLLGLPVKPIDGAEPPPPPLLSEARANQQIAVHVQRISRMCGDAIVFENQIEDLVRAGFLTIRIFADAKQRRGATLQSRQDAIIRENGTRAAAHVSVFAVPDGPPSQNVADADPETRLRTLLPTTASCRVRDVAIAQVAEQATCVIANGLESVGPALSFAPQARLLLSLQENRPTILYHWAMLAGRGKSLAQRYAQAAAEVQTQLLGIADACSFVNPAEATQLAPACRRAVTISPRMSQDPRQDSPSPWFDVLFAGSEHQLNVISLRWFLEQVWRPYLEPNGISVAIVGRAAASLPSADLCSPLLHLLGFVEDLEAIRTRSRLSVVPETGGSGLSMKLLSALAAGHPIATTKVGLRGLTTNPTLPAYNTADSLAADIVELVKEPERLEERRRLVRQVRDAIGNVGDHSRLIMALPRPNELSVRDRTERWARFVATAAAAEPLPFAFAPNTAFPLSGSPWDSQVLLDGWHEAEPWGRWTDGPDAGLRIELAAPTNEPLALELDIVPSVVGGPLRIRVNDTAFPLMEPVRGTNDWDLPSELTTGRRHFVVSLHVGATVCPADGGSPDDRILGIGITSVRLASVRPTLCRFDDFMSIRAGAMPSRVLLAGWHEPEDWGCWTSKATAALRLLLPEPAETSIRLELDLALPPQAGALTLTANGIMLPAKTPIKGSNTWDLPSRATAGRSELIISLTVADMFCAARAGLSDDDRELGVGLSGIRLLRFIPVISELGVPLRLARSAALEEVLLSGWHKAEDWGSWTSQQSAILRLMFREPLNGPCRLAMDLVAGQAGRTLVLSINGEALPPVIATGGSNDWDLPEALTEGQLELHVTLEMSETFCPAETGTSSDDRILGIGVRQVTLHSTAVPVFPIGTLVRLSSDQGDHGLLLEGWHKLEPWGCWSSGGIASMRVRFDKPLQDGYALEFDLIPPLLDHSVTVGINDVILNSLDAIEGPNEWILPPACTEGQTELTIHLLVDRPARPADFVDSKDDRVLGVGVRALRIRSVRQDERLPTDPG